MITFPNYVLKHLAQSQEHNIVETLRTISKAFDSQEIDAQETLKFLTDTKNFDTEKFAIINLNDTNVSIFSKAHAHEKSTIGKLHIIQINK